MIYRIIYYWKGERHVSLIQPTTQASADSIVNLFRKDGCRAHWERA